MPFSSSSAYRELHSAGGHVSVEQGGSQYTMKGVATSVPAALRPMPQAVATVKVQALAAGANPGHSGVLGSQTSAMLQALVEDHGGTYTNDTAAKTYLNKLGMK